MNYSIHELISPINPKKINHSCFAVSGKLVPSGSHDSPSSLKLTKVKVLHGLSLEILASQVVALVGPSGNGKSTDAGTFLKESWTFLMAGVWHGFGARWRVWNLREVSSGFEDENVEDCNPLEQSIQKTKPIHVLSSQNWLTCFFRYLKKQTENKDDIRAFEIHWGHWIGQKALPCSRNLANKFGGWL